MTGYVDRLASSLATRRRVLRLLFSTVAAGLAAPFVGQGAAGAVPAAGTSVPGAPYLTTSRRPGSFPLVAGGVVPVWHPRLEYRMWGTYSAERRT